MPFKPASASVLDLVSQTILKSIESENPASEAQELSPDQNPASEILCDAQRMEEAIASTVDRLKQRLIESLVEVRRRHNSLLPIQRLPWEMLSSALAYEMDGVERHNHLQRLLQLSSVSRWWNAVILGTPSLWSIINSTDTSEIISLALERSKDSPLTVILNDGSNHEFRNLQGRYIYSLEESRFLDLVCPHMGRWREASFPCLKSDDSIGHLHEAGVQLSPHLQQFHLIRLQPPTIDQSTFRFPVRAGQLRNLKLENLVISAGEIIGVLDVSTRLESLDLRSLIEGAVADEQHLPHNLVSPVSLSRLVTINLLWLPSAIMVPILEHVKAPNLKDITIRHDTNVRSTAIEEANTPEIGPFTTLVSHLLETTPSMYLYLKDSGFYLKDHSETTCHYEVELKGSHSLLLRWLRLRCLPQLTKRYHMHLDFDPEFAQDASDELVVENLMRLPQVKSLRLRTHPEAWRWVWYLSLPDVMPSGSAHSWLWPELTELTLEAGTINEVATLSMLLGRFGLPSEEPRRDGPSSFRILTVRSGGYEWRTEIVERIKSIVGDERFVWA